MIQDNQKINPKIFDADCEKDAIRNGFGDGIILAAEADDRVVGLCADLADSVKIGGFAKKFPKRYFEMGIAEQSMASVASGMAAMGKIPYAASYAMFNPGRNWEQIRTTICYNNQPVKLIGGHAGITTGPDGGTHQALEDIGILRPMPNINVIVPCDYDEAKKATIKMAKVSEPFYLRLAREKTPKITTEDSPFEFGKINVLWRAESPRVAIVACGIMVYEALLAAKKLFDMGVWVVVANMHTIKPMDEETLLSLAKMTSGKFVTAEEHQIIGGLGSAVAETLSRVYPSRIEYVGVKNRFGQSGEGAELQKEYGLTSEDIVMAVRKVID